MGYSIHRHISYRQKIELGSTGLPVIRPVISVFINMKHAGKSWYPGNNHWGNYGPFLLLAIWVDKSAAFISMVMCFIHIVCLFSVIYRFRVSENYWSCGCAFIKKFGVIWPKNKIPSPNPTYVVQKQLFWCHDGPTPKLVGINYTLIPTIVESFYPEI